MLDAFYNIGMTNEANLEKVKDALISFIEDHKNVYPNLNFMYLTIDRLVYQFYMEKAKSLTLGEAIQEYQQLV